MKLDPYIRTIADYESRLIDALDSNNCAVYLDTSTLMWALRINAQAREQFFDWCRSFGERLRIPVWAAHELQRHLIEDTVRKTIKERSSACERQFHDFISLVSERSDESIARAVGAGSSDTLIASARIIQGQVRKLSDAIQAGNLSSAYEKIIEFVNEFVIDSDLLKISEVLSVVGEFRYTHRVPPGFRDGAKSENRYGDLVMWEEILRDGVSEDSGQEGHACIFVSQDEKTDWISASPLVEAGNGPEKQNRDHAKDVPLAHPLLQHEYEKRGGSGTVFVVTPRRLSIIVSKVAKSKPELSWRVDEWGKVSYLDGLVAKLRDDSVEEEDQTRPPSKPEPPVDANSVHDGRQVFPPTSDVLAGSVSSRLEKARDLDPAELDALLNGWLSEVLTGKLKPHLFGRLLATIQGSNSVAAVGAVLAKARQQASNEDNAAIFYGLGVGLYFDASSTLRTAPSSELGEIFLELCQDPLFAEGLSALTSALEEAALPKTFLPGSTDKVRFEIESTGSNPKTITELRIDGNVVTETTPEATGKKTLASYFQGHPGGITPEELISLVGRVYLIAPNRITNSYGKRRFALRPDMGLVELDLLSPEGFQLPSED